MQPFYGEWGGVRLVSFHAGWPCLVFTRSFLYVWTLEVFLHVQNFTLDSDMSHMELGLPQLLPFTSTTYENVFHPNAVNILRFQRLALQYTHLGGYKSASNSLSPHSIHAFWIPNQSKTWYGHLNSTKIMCRHKCTMRVFF